MLLKGQKRSKRDNCDINVLRSCFMRTLWTDMRMAQGKNLVARYGIQNGMYTRSMVYAQIVAAFVLVLYNFSIRVFVFGRYFLETFEASVIDICSSGRKMSVSRTCICAAYKIALHYLILSVEFGKSS